MGLGDFISGLGNMLTGTSPQANVGQYGLLSPEQQKALDQLLAQLTGGASPLTQQYGGQLTAPQNLAQMASLTALENASQAMVPGAPGSPTDTSASALKDVIQAGPQDLTDYFQKSIAAPLMQQFTQQVMPATEGRFAGQGVYGSDFMKQQGIDVGNLGTAMSSALSDAVTKSLQAQQANKIQAALGLSNVGATGINDILGIQAGAGTAQQFAQSPLTAAYQQFLQGQQGQQANINAILNALGIKTKETIATVTPGTSGLMGGIGQGLGTGLGIGIGKGLMGP